jgi:DNA (cytosine-5)-methyltransferase 1
MRVIDFFCGAGGFSEGFRIAGFNIIWGVDRWQTAVDTHRANHSQSNTIKGDVISISQLPDEEFHALVPDSEIIIGSPPCVAFSNSNRSGKGDKSKGKKLIEAYLRIVARKKFREGSVLQYWLLENVPKAEPYIKESYTAGDLGLPGNFTLQVKHHNSGVHNAQYFGVPSNRKRYICGEFISPEALIGDDDNLIPMRNVLNALGTPCADQDRIVTDPNYPLHLRSGLITDHHYVKRLAQYEWKKAKRLKEDKGYMGKMAFPENIDLPSRTIMATLTFSARESFILKNGDRGYRAPTIREVASFMSFPIDYRFYGNSIGTKYKLVGNAVPPKMAYAFALAIARAEQRDVPVAPPPIRHRDSIAFHDLNNTDVPVNVEKPKRDVARFKYHIPYLKIDSFRVELTNHNSKPEKKKFKWDTEIHWYQGPSAQKYLTKIKPEHFKKSTVESVNRFIRSLMPYLVDHDAFQRIYCKTESERRKKEQIGPYELLERVKEFVKAQGLEGHVKVTGIPKLLPAPIALGSYTLSRILTAMNQK